MRRWSLLVVAAVVLSCKKEEEVGTVVGPGLTVEIPDGGSRTRTGTSTVTSTVASTSTGTDAGQEAPFGPVSAEFVELGASGFHTEHVACEQRIVALTKGKASVLGETLAPGDVLVTQGTGGYDVKGDGLLVFAIARPFVCEPNQFTTINKHVFRAKAAPEVRWAGGKMLAHLDVEKDNAPFAYVGRLEGTAAVAEHAHDASWEVLCAVEASGTFTLDGKAQHLAGKTCVSVPPKAKHSWAPDAGSKLLAVQFYSPGGPEQRFRTLAAQEADGGVRADGGK